MRAFDLGAFDAPLTVPELRAGPMVLRPFVLSDLTLIRHAATDPYISAITSVPAVYSDDGGRAFIERQHSQAREGHGYSFVIADSSEPSRGLGGLGLWLSEIDSGRAALGYWTAPFARGAHVAGRALRVVVQFAFEELAIPRLHLFIEPWNVASQRTAEFAGFEREALLRSWERVDDAQRDVHSYVLLRHGHEGPSGEHLPSAKLHSCPAVTEQQH